MEELDAKKCQALLEIIQTLNLAKSLLNGRFRATQYDQMMQEFFYNCKEMVEDLEWVIENEIDVELNPYLTSKS